MDRAYYEKEIGEILEGYKKEKPSDYRAKTVELIASIENEEYLKKIYSFALAFHD